MAVNVHGELNARVAERLYTWVGGAPLDSNRSSRGSVEIAPSTVLGRYAVDGVEAIYYRQMLDRISPKSSAHIIEHLSARLPSQLLDRLLSGAHRTYSG